MRRRAQIENLALLRLDLKQEQIKVPAFYRQQLIKICNGLVLVVLEKMG